jgi:nucleotide-binding universal stress UspA family protein
MHDEVIAPHDFNGLSPGTRTELAIATEIQSPRLSQAQDGLGEHTPQNTHKRIRKILVPTDFTSAAALALKRAVTLANQCVAAITILHVIDINAQGAGTADYLMKGLWSEGSSQMGRLAWSLSGQVEAQTMLQEGLPWEEIVERSSDFDLVILGKSRANKRWKLFSNHTVERVAENAACPVMVVQDDSL